MSKNGQDSYNHNRRQSFNPNGAPHNPTGSPPNTLPQYGAPPQAHPTFPFTAVPQGPIPPSESFEHRRGPQSPVALNIPPCHVEQPRSGLDGRPSPSEHPRWDNNTSGGLPHQVSQGHPGGYTDINSSAKPAQPRRTSYAYNPPPPPPPPLTEEREFSPRTATQYCRIPDCRNKAFYDFAEQEQTEYCGQGHELQAISTGLVNRCAMCKGRPRRTGERVCSRTCRERERQASPVQGSYYGVPVERRETRTGPGALSG